eukprot:5367116-Prymnesium_polylepis.1
MPRRPRICSFPRTLQAAGRCSRPAARAEVARASSVWCAESSHRARRRHARSLEVLRVCARAPSAGGWERRAVKRVLRAVNHFRWSGQADTYPRTSG